MTIFPTHKTELKTKLSRQEVIDRLEFNNFYYPNTDYVLKKLPGHFMLMSVHHYDPPTNANTFRAKIVINPEKNGSTVRISYYPDERDVIKYITLFSIMMIVQVILIIVAIQKSFMMLAVFTPLIFAPILYLATLIFFSVLAVTLEKQIEEAIEAEIHEVTEDEMSKLQKWYEKKR